MIRRLMLALLLLFSICLNAWEATYHVKSLGITVSRISLNVTPRRIKVRANNSGSALAPAMNNTYVSYYNSGYLPSSFSRKVVQDSDRDSVYTTYNHNTGNATLYRHSTRQIIQYSLPANTRDLFSLLAYISSNQPSRATRYTVDGNGSIWDADLEVVSREQVRTKIGKLLCNEYRISLSGRGITKAPYVDMVTNNILNRDTVLNLWIADSGLITMARVRRGITSMNWELQDYRN